MKVAIYCRVSTDEQNPKHQEDALLEFSQQKNYEVYKIYTDMISGSKDSRPALNEMLMDAYSHKFESILVWKLDRLGRSLQHLIRIINNIKLWNINLIVSTQQIDTTTPMGMLIFHIFGAIAEFERELIRERTKQGMKKAQNIGKRGKDKNPRKKGGYYLRYQKKGSQEKEPFLI